MTMFSRKIVVAVVELLLLWLFFPSMTLAAGDPPSAAIVVSVKPTPVPKMPSETWEGQVTLQFKDSHNEIEAVPPNTTITWDCEVKKDSSSTLLTPSGLSLTPSGSRNEICTFAGAWTSTGVYHVKIKAHATNLAWNNPIDKEITFDEPVKDLVFRITDQSGDVTLADIRPGIGSSRVEQDLAWLMRSSAGAAVTATLSITANSGASVRSACSISGISLSSSETDHSESANFSGSSASSNEHDNEIVAKDSSNNLINSVGISVVVPYKIAKHHPTGSQVKNGQNMVINSTTSPAYFETMAPGEFELATVYAYSLTIVVNDQFGQTLSKVYENAEVREFLSGQMRKINSKMSSSGTYTDPVGWWMLAGKTSNNSDIVKWRQGTDPGYTPIPVDVTDSETQNLTVSVDGIQLDTGIVGRTVGHTAGNPSTITVTWP